MNQSPIFRSKRADTTVASIESKYVINLNARGEMLLGNPDERGFDSPSQLIEAYRGILDTSPAKTSSILEVLCQSQAAGPQGFRLMAINPNVDLDFFDRSRCRDE